MIYEYECQKCGVFEKVISLKDFTTTTECPHCNGVSEKIISGSRPQTFEPYFDKVQNRYFKTKNDFEGFLRKNNFYKPTAREIKAHREYYADIAPRKENKSNG